jgi:recombination protein RecR
MTSYSPLIAQLINALQCLEGVGPKSARRMAFALLGKNKDKAHQLVNHVQQALTHIKPCQRCQLLTENTLCQICENPKRQRDLLCIVESPADVMAIEQTHAFGGYYFVLSGRLSPLDGLGPKEIGLDLLFNRLRNEKISEIIIATSATIEGEATAHYIADDLKNHPIKCSRIAHGIPLGGELEYLDGGTLNRALQARINLADETATDR